MVFVMFGMVLLTLFLAVGVAAVKDAQLATAASDTLRGADLVLGFRSPPA